MLFFDVILHIGRLLPDLSHDLLFSGYPLFLLLNQPILDASELSPNGVEMVVMVLDPILSFLIDPPLGLIHPHVVLGPVLSEYLALLVNLVFQVVTKLIKLILELVLKLVDHIVDVVHAVDCVFPILGDLGVGIVELLLHLPLVLNSRVF